MNTCMFATAKANIQLLLKCCWHMWALPPTPPIAFYLTTPPLPPPHLLLPPLTYCLVLWYTMRLQAYAGIFPSSCSRLNLHVREDDSAACIRAAFSEADSKRQSGGRKSVCAALSAEEASLTFIASGVALTLQKVWGTEKLPLICFRRFLRSRVHLQWKRKTFTYSSPLITRSPFRSPPRLWGMSEQQHWGTSAASSHGRWTAVAFTSFSQNEAGLLRSCSILHGDADRSVCIKVLRT